MHEGITPRRGVVAGCPLATTLAKVYVLRALKRFMTREEAVGLVLQLYIDDAQLDRVGAMSEVLRLAGDAEELLRVIRGELRAEVSFEKAQLVASSKKMTLAAKCQVSIGTQCEGTHLSISRRGERAYLRNTRN